jgi:hypothetical protein
MVNPLKIPQLGFTSPNIATTKKNKNNVTSCKKKAINYCSIFLGGSRDPNDYSFKLIKDETVK